MNSPALRTMSLKAEDITSIWVFFQFKISWFVSGEWKETNSLKNWADWIRICSLDCTEQWLFILIGALEQFKTVTCKNSGIPHPYLVINDPTVEFGKIANKPLPHTAFNIMIPIHEQLSKAWMCSFCEQKMYSRSHGDSHKTPKWISSSSDYNQNPCADGTT